MASREINLLSEKLGISQEEQTLRRILGVWTPLVLGVYLFVLSGVLISAVYLRSQLNRIDNSISGEKTRIQALEKSEGTYLLLKQKASVLTKILGSRFPYSDLLTYFKNLESTEAKVKSLSVSSAGELSTSVSVRDAETMDSLFKGLLAEGTIYFSRVELGSVLLKQTGEYDLSLSLIKSSSRSSEENL